MSTMIEPSGAAILRGSAPTQAAPSGRLSARDRILRVADELFYRHGIRAIGIDRIIAAAGVAKMSLYRAFASKEDLVAAYLADRDRQFWARWERAIAGHQGDARAQLEALLDAITGRATQPDYRGCPFLNTATEFPGDAPAADALIRAHKQRVNARLLAMAAAAGAGDPQALADQLQLIIDGAYAAGQAMGADGPARALAHAGRVLIRAAVEPATI